jgi:hypothetical protein
MAPFTKSKSTAKAAPRCRGASLVPALPESISIFQPQSEKRNILIMANDYKLLLADDDNCGHPPSASSASRRHRRVRSVLIHGSGTRALAMAPGVRQSPFYFLSAQKVQTTKEDRMPMKDDTYRYYCGCQSVSVVQ